MGYIARGRYALFNGDVETAQTNWNSASRARSDMYEVFLLKAEIDYKNGKVGDAKATLESLASDLSAPKWIRDFASEKLKLIP
jgi:hypothetical protein